MNSRKPTTQALPDSGKICDAVQDGDTLICDMTTKEIWVKAVIVIKSSDVSKDIKHYPEVAPIRYL